MRKLPIGIQTFEKIREDDYVYVDKTDIALSLIQSSGYYFLSRPRRFGKSLFLDTLRNIFEAKKELFEGLYIYDRYDWSRSYPVIKISWAGDLKSVESIRQTAFAMLKSHQYKFGISCDESQNLSLCFKELIQKSYEKFGQRVVILIDEYDKPILDNIEDKETAREAREELKNLYSIIKDSDEYVKFVFITGVSKFSKVSLFSGLNNIEDITVDSRYATITGYTQRDLETSFYEHLKDQDFEKIKRWYNGYAWLGERVYNPFDILLFIAKGYSYQSYWFSTGTPTFLLKLIESNRYFLPDLESVVKDSQMLDSFDVDYIDIETLMWQTGYLTIGECIKTPFGANYKLKIPNLEVQIALLNSVGEYMTKIYNTLVHKSKIYESLETRNLASFESSLKALFASIAYTNYTNNNIDAYEGYYASVVYAYLASLGVELIAEDTTNRGRIDLTLIFSDTIYIIEFKVGDSAINAIEQIKNKRYYQKYQNTKTDDEKAKEIILVGIGFSKEDKNIESFVWEGV